MRPSEALQKYREQIRNLAEVHRTTNARIFGSVLHGTDTNGSDLDILVDPLPETSLFDLGGLQADLEKILRVPVDVLTPRDLPAHIRGKVIDEARPI